MHLRLPLSKVTICGMRPEAVPTTMDKHKATCAGCLAGKR